MKKTFSFSEFKPTILFLVKFVGIYLMGNLLYGFYVNSYKPGPDMATRWVAHQTVDVLRFTAHPTTASDHTKKAIVSIKYNQRTVISIYEGCNGINVFIIFVAFVIAFGPFQKAMLWFIPAGLLLIHFFNLLRISGLFLIALRVPDFLYFTHKYLFTAFIYYIVFLLWIWWVQVYTPKRAHGKT